MSIVHVMHYIFIDSPYSRKNIAFPNKRVVFLYLGPMVISWKKSDANGGSLNYLATGTHRLTQDTRVSVEESNDKGSTLVISFANDQDVGDYVCEVSSNPPATLRHHVALIGKCIPIQNAVFQC